MICFLNSRWTSYERGEWDMELRQLHYFLAVAEELNFSRAAERLLITQPPLSLQIQNLEKELGVKLFQRNNRQVSLTEAGKVFYEEVTKITEHLRRAIVDTQRTHNGEIGTLKVGFVGSATYDILPVILRDFRKQFPFVKIQLYEMSSPKQIQALCEEEIDVGVLRPPVKEKSLQIETVSTSPCVLAVPEHHPILEKNSISLEDLRSYPFVMLSRKTWSGFYDEILETFQPLIVQEAFEFQTVIGLVAGGLGIAVVPQPAIQLHTKDVVYIDLKDFLPQVSMVASCRQNDPSVLVKAFMEKAREVGSV